MSSSPVSDGEPLRAVNRESILPAPALSAGHEELKARVNALAVENRELKARVRALELTVDRLVGEGKR